MTINEMMTEEVNKIVKEFGQEHMITSGELKQIMFEKYGANKESIIPGDYCYNRTNKGVIGQEKPLLFEYAENRYRCLGSNYPYNGPVYHKSKETGIERIVGKCVNGKQIITEDIV